MVESKADVHHDTSPPRRGSHQVYDRTRSYRWNYENCPEHQAGPSQSVPENAKLTADRIVSRESVLDPGPLTGVKNTGPRWDFFGHSLSAPIGVAAGPLLNGAWCLHYASLGFDLLTYKTVRTQSRECYAMPNLVPVNARKMTGRERYVQACDEMEESWAVSFGMPSSSPSVWRRDVEWTRERLSPNQVLSVSVVGSQQAGWSLKDLADDYATCAKWAVESGANVVEANFSCPNVSTCDGQLFQNPEDSNLVAEVIRCAIGSVPLVIKIGHVPETHRAVQLVEALDGVVDGLSMTNSLAAQVMNESGAAFFNGEFRGICGDAIRDASIAQVARFRAVTKQIGSNMKLIGVGGVSAAEHVQDYLAAGADSCHLATAVMMNPNLGHELSQAFS